MWSRDEGNDCGLCFPRFSGRWSSSAIPALTFCRRLAAASLALLTVIGLDDFLKALRIPDMIRGVKQHCIQANVYQLLKALDPSNRWQDAFLSQTESLH